MTRYTSTHKLLGSIELEIDWEDAGHEGMGPADWDWGDIRAFEGGKEIELGRLGEILDAAYERDKAGALGFRDEMIEQLNGAREEARLANVDDHLVSTVAGPAYRVGGALFVDREYAAYQLRKEAV